MGVFINPKTGETKLNTGRTEDFIPIQEFPPGSGGVGDIVACVRLKIEE